MRATSGGLRVIYAHTHIESYGTHRRPHDVVYLRIKERSQSLIHGERRGAARGHVHARGQHGNGNLSAFLIVHGVQLVLQGHVVWSGNNELYTRLVEVLRQLHAAMEIHRPAHAASVIHVGLYQFRGSDVQVGIHRVSHKLNITSILYGESLQRYHRQRILHHAITERIASRQLQAFGCAVSHKQVTATH